MHFFKHSQHFPFLAHSSELQGPLRTQTVSALQALFDSQIFHKSRQPPSKSHFLLATTGYFRILGCQGLLLSSYCTNMETLQEAGEGERASLKRGLRASVRRQQANQSGGCLRQFSLAFTKLGGLPLKVMLTHPYQEPTLCH